MRDSGDSKTDELLEMLEEMQGENEDLQDHISEAQRTISQLSSESSVLKNELQKKSETIVALNARIEKLNGSDLVLKQNEQLVRQNRELQLNAQKSREEAAAMVSTIKREYALKEQELDNRIRQAARQERIARDMAADYKNKVAEEAKRVTAQARVAAEQEYSRKAAKAENEYREKRNAVYGVIMGSLLYGFFATTLTACNSPRFIKDFSVFLDVMWQLAAGPVLLAVEACEMTWTVKDMIPYPVLDVIVAVILVVLIFALITGLIYGLTGFIFYKAAKIYHEEFWDLTSGIVALVTMGILVWFADMLSWITWNLILVWLLIHGGYILIRMMVTNGKGNRY